jgi:hypothetical protein
MFWVIGGIVVGLIGGAAMTWYVIVANVSYELGQAFGLPTTKPFWKRWS